MDKTTVKRGDPSRGAHEGELNGAPSHASPSVAGSTPPADAPVGGEIPVSVVVPVHNAEPFLRRTAPAILAAARRIGEFECLFVDNGSTDGSAEYLRSLGAPELKVLRSDHRSIAGVRNQGASLAKGRYISFLDADCLIAEDYYEHALEAVRATGAVATGCEVSIPSEPHWIEATWHHLHYPGTNRYVRYLNSGNFFVSRAAFREVGGFDEELVTDEDTDIGLRIGAAGHRIYAATRVDAVHLGNPKSTREFYRRIVWHAQGANLVSRGGGIDKPMLMLVMHVLATGLGVAILFSGLLPTVAAVASLLALQGLIPALTVFFRCRQTRRTGYWLPGVALYWLYYLAKLHGALLILSRRRGTFRK